MRAAEAILPGMPAPLQGPQKDARPGDAATSEQEPAGERQQFKDLLSALAGETKDGEGPGGKGRGEDGEPRDAAIPGTALRLAIVRSGSLADPEPVAPGKDDTAVDASDEAPQTVVTGFDRAFAAIPILEGAAVPSSSGFADTGSGSPEVCQKTGVAGSDAAAMGAEMPSQSIDLDIDPLLAAQTAHEDRTDEGPSVSSLAKALDDRDLATAARETPAPGSRTVYDPPLVEMRTTVLKTETHLARTSTPVSILTAAVRQVFGLPAQDAPAADDASASEDAGADPSKALSTPEPQADRQGATVALEAGGGQRSARESRGAAWGLPDLARPDTTVKGAAGEANGQKDAAAVADQTAAARVAAGVPNTVQISPGDQIARRIVSEFGAFMPGDSGAAAQSSAASDSQATGGTLKVLHIELEPASLGKVTVRLELKDDVINLRVETSHRETAAAIERDRDTLTSVLKSAGYLVDGITAQAAEPAKGPAIVQTAAPEAQSQLSSNGQSQSGLSQSHHRSGGSQSQGSADAGQGGVQRVNESAENSPARASGALYV